MAGRGVFQATKSTTKAHNETEMQTVQNNKPPRRLEMFVVRRSGVSLPSSSRNITSPAHTAWCSKGIVVA